MNEERQDQWIGVAMGLWDGLSKVVNEHPRDWVQTVESIEKFADAANAVMQFELNTRSYDAELERRRKEPWE